MYKVLVVEDETIIRKGLIFAMPWNELNCAVIGEAANGVEGVAQIAALKPDIVIVDINMPMMNGFEMIRQTSDQFVYSAIIISGYHEFEYAKRAIRYGVSEYLLKPVDHEELKEAIRNACKQVDMRRLYHAEIVQEKKVQSIKVLQYEIIKKQSLSPLTMRMIDYIERNYATKIVMDDLVKELSSSTTLLNQRFKKETSLTFNDYLNRYRIQMAINMIKENEEPLYVIAEKCGFSDYKYFHIVFKKYLGCSPKTFAGAIFP